ncbi:MULTISPECIES: permease [unclassified Arthrobacter]|uniref:permease n=1 Tax=unclassified Arthrobacter TaxID=235627 RepID=UPI00159D5B44|nr:MULTISPECIES: permease [unclassified Arthrobacter]MCQ9164564.1 permease [Arthrobacter sp. STN4]NVM97131.1 permease [Arthrobacter sp. SDTb3-6]
MKSSIAGLVGIVALAAIVAGHSLGLGWTVGVAVVLSVGFGYGWPQYLGIPAKKTLGAVIALSGAGAALAGGLTRDANFLVWTPVFIAFGFGAVMVVQLLRGAGQEHRLESTLGAGAGVLIAGFAAGWVSSYRFLGEPGMTVVAATGAGVALVIGMLPWPDRVLAPLAIVLAALAGPLAALLVSELRIVPAAVIGALVAAVIASFHRLRTLSGPVPNVAGGLAAAAAPVLALGALVYFMEKLLLT